jgi:hypothetical protein
MSKNMTRKGLAFGAGFALIASSLVASPAFASGIDNGSVSLAPTTGAEYNMIAGGTLKLSSNMATGVRGTGQYLKFQVEDALGDSSVLYSQSSQYSELSDAGNDYVVTDGTGTTLDTVAITMASATKFKAGDRVDISGIATNADGVGDVLADGTIHTIDSVSVNGLTISIKVVATAFTADAAASDQDITLKLVASTPASGKYILDTKIDTVTADKTIAIKSTDKNVSQSVTVTAWVDSNDNGLIDTTEYRSPARTLNFLASSAITPTVKMLPAYVGESTVKAEVTFSPVLNGSQLTDSNLNRSSVAAAVQVHFTRPGSTKTMVAETVTYSNTTKVFTATSYDMSNNVANNEDASDRAAGWAIAQPNLYSALATTKSAIKSNVITLTVGSAHGLQVGDIIKVASSNVTGVNEAAVKITSVPTTTTLTYKSTSTSALTDVAEAADTNGRITANVPATGANHPTANGTAVTNVANTVIARNAVVAGQYSAQALLFRHDATLTDALTKIGSAAGLTVGATTADSATLEGVPSATVNAAGKVAKGTLTGQVVLAVVDEDEEPVAAGVPVTITATRNTGAGTLKVNGTTLVGTTASTLSAVTDAAGKVFITFENSLGAAGDRIDLSTNVQGVTDSLNVVWENPKYSIYDSADAAADSSARNRAAAADGSYTFDLWVQDQFKNAAPADIRLLATVTGRTTQTAPVALTNGRATFKVTPDGSAVTGDTTVKFNFQKRDTLGVWNTQNGADDYIDWFASEDNDLAPVLIKFYSQTDAVNLNANGANFPSSTAADFTANVTTLAYKANDARVTTGVAGAYVAAEKAVVSGNVANSVTGAAKAGASVTVSGSGLLFNVGDVWAADTLTFVAGDGTYAITVVSRSAGDKVVTVTSGAASKTATLTFSAVAAVTGYSVKLTTPASVQSGSTYRVDGQVLDVNGNGIAITTAGTGTNPTLTVTYMGLGLVSGSLPATTDKDGKFYFYVLVGSNDKGTATVTASYDADGTATTSKAATSSSTVYIGQAAPATVGTGKVNVGSFNGKLVVYASGLNGKRISWKVGGNWGSAVADSNYDIFNRPTPRAGVTLNVEIFVDGKSALTKSVVTR